MPKQGSLNQTWWTTLVAWLALLWEAISALVNSSTDKRGSERPGSAAAKRRKQRRKERQAAVKAGEAAPGTGAAGAAAAAAQAPSDSDNEDSEEEDQPAGPSVLPRGAYRPMVSTTAAGDGDAAWEAWEPAGRGGKKPSQKAGISAYGAGPRARGAAAAASPNQQQRKGDQRKCERPECGAEGRAGFRKCGRCHEVWYCTPACLASDWERHQLNCS